MKPGLETTTFNAGNFGFSAEFSDFGLRKLSFGPKWRHKTKPLPEKWAILKRELEEYLAGERQDFTLPLDLEEVSDFDFKVYEQLLVVPYGKTVSYGELAKRIGKPNGARAVGQAVGRNPIGIIVPCHRVVAANGIGGFGGGLPLKRKLLEIEGIVLP